MRAPATGNGYNFILGDAGFIGRLWKRARLGRTRSCPRSLNKMITRKDLSLCRNCLQGALNRLHQFGEAVRFSEEGHSYGSA